MENNSWANEELEQAAYPGSILSPLALKNPTRAYFIQELTSFFESTEAVCLTKLGASSNSQARWPG